MALFSVDASRGRGDKLGTIFTMPTPQNFWRPKNRPKFLRFLTTFDFDREYLWKRSTYQKSEKLLIIYNPSHVWEKKIGVLWSTLVCMALYSLYCAEVPLRNCSLTHSRPQTKKLLTLINVHPNGLFSETIFRPIGGATAWNFIRARDWPRLPSAHPNWDAGPPKNI